LFFGAGDWIVYNGAVWQRVEGGSDGNFSNVTLNSTDAGATAGPLLDLYRNSATPAASDTIGEIEFNGQDSAGNKQQYAVIHGSILSPTSTTEQGQIHFETATAGASTEKMIIGTTNLVINEIGAVFNVRIEGDTDANLFYTDATNSRVGVGTISPAQKLDVAGAIQLSDNLIPSTAAKGINFTANTPTAASGAAMTSQLLNWYEEGTWTPLITFGSASVGVTYNATFTGGYYVRVGSLVMLTAVISMTSKGSSTGVARLEGFPFPIPTGGHRYTAASVPISSGVTYVGSLSLDIAPNTSAGVFVDTTGNIQNTGFSNATGIQISFSYVTG
jgi:hypothetical protein